MQQILGGGIRSTYTGNGTQRLSGTDSFSCLQLVPLEGDALQKQGLLDMVVSPHADASADVVFGLPKGTPTSSPKRTPLPSSKAFSEQHPSLQEAFLPRSAETTPEPQPQPILAHNLSKGKVSFRRGSGSHANRASSSQRRSAPPVASRSENASTLHGSVPPIAAANDVGWVNSREGFSPRATGRLDIRAPAAMGPRDVGLVGSGYRVGAVQQTDSQRPGLNVSTDVQNQEASDDLLNRMLFSAALK